MGTRRTFSDRFNHWSPQRKGIQVGLWHPRITCTSGYQQWFLQWISLFESTEGNQGIKVPVILFATRIKVCYYFQVWRFDQSNICIYFSLKAEISFSLIMIWFAGINNIMHKRICLALTKQSISREGWRQLKQQVFILWFQEIESFKN